MQLAIKGVNCQVSDDLRAYVEKKMQALDRYSARIVDAAVEFKRVSRKKEEVKAEITLHVPRAILRVEEKSRNQKVAFDVGLQRLKKRLLRFKKRREHKKRGGKREGILEAPEKAMRALPIAKEKEFPVERLSVEEAALRLEDIDHDFFIFEDARTNAVSVIYRRENGSFGLLRPKLPT